jgi:Velvet factor
MQHPGSHRGPPPPPQLAMPNRYAQPSNPYALTTMPLPSPRLERDAEGFLIMDEPSAVSTKYDGREWSLEVPQQPIRARMCGFGDKACPPVFYESRCTNIIQDRRPITPPPCVRLIVRDPMTGREIDAQSVTRIASYPLLTHELRAGTSTSPFSSSRLTYGMKRLKRKSI